MKKSLLLIPVVALFATSCGGVKPLKSNLAKFGSEVESTAFIANFGEQSNAFLAAHPYMNGLDEANKSDVTVTKLIEGIHSTEINFMHGGKVVSQEHSSEQFVTSYDVDSDITHDFYNFQDDYSDSYGDEHYIDVYENYYFVNEASVNKEYGVEKDEEKDAVTNPVGAFRGIVYGSWTSFGDAFSCVYYETFEDYNYGNNMKYYQNSNVFTITSEGNVLDDFNIPSGYEFVAKKSVISFQWIFEANKISFIVEEDVKDASVYDDSAEAKYVVEAAYRRFQLTFDFSPVAETVPVH